MKHACFLTFPQPSVVPARLYGAAVNQSKELIWLPVSITKSIWYMASFQNVNELQKTNNLVRKCAHIGISCAGCELVSWSDWKHRIFPSTEFQISAFPCLGDVVSVGWGYNCQGIHSLYKRSLDGFGMGTVRMIHPIISRKCLGKCYTQKSKCL